MFNCEIVSQFVWGDLEIFYLKQGDIYGFTIVPHTKVGEMVEHRAELKDTLACRSVAQAFNYNFPAYELESMIQYKVTGDAYFPQHAPGNSMRNSSSVQKLTYLGQESSSDRIVTKFRDAHGLLITHTVKAGENYRYVTVNTALTNESAAAVKLESVQSFSLGMISPFQREAGANQYQIHRYRSCWSAEGRPEVRSAEELGLEASWQGAGVRALRFGQRSSMPIKEFFPYIAIEDTAQQVFWGAQLAAVGPWELEVSRYGDFLNLSGGQIDREMVGWTKNLAPGATFAGADAVLSCVAGTKAQLNANLQAFAMTRDLPVPASEASAPLMFNEWCTSWGHPEPERLLPIAQKWQNSPIKYFVMDDGWFRSEVAPQYILGDWVESQDKYPQGLKKFCDQLRQLGFIPGIWFEFENALENAQNVKLHPDWYLHLDGEILQVGSRRFLDFRKKEVWKFLDERLIKMLKDNEIGYLKVDYNAAIPFGVDGADSAPENLREHLQAVQKYFRHLRQELPDLVLEICASGGHRLSPFWLQLGDLCSATDAHEGVEIPLIAAHLGEFIPMTKSQIWAVIRPDDDDKRLHYSLAAAFMGRLCLSGDLAQLKPAQEYVIGQAMDFYAALAPLLKNGLSEVKTSCLGAWNSPQGYQIFTRTSAQSQLVVIHTFAGGPDKVKIAVPDGWSISRIFQPEAVHVEAAENQIELCQLSDFDGVALLLSRP